MRGSPPLQKTESRGGLDRLTPCVKLRKNGRFCLSANPLRLLRFMLWCSMARRKRERGVRGKGSVHRRPDGTWCASFSTHALKIPSKNKRAYFYGQSRAEVVARMDEAIALAKRGAFVPGNDVTIGRLMVEWLEDVMRSRLRVTTYSHYKRTIEKHIAPRIGTRHVNDVRPPDFRVLYARMEKDGISPRVRHQAHKLLRGAFRYALREGTIAVDPTAAVTAPVYRAERRMPLTEREVQKLIAAARGTPHEALIVVALATGARQGELLALQWDDVDLARGTISIRRSLANVDGKLILQEPKTESSRRSIAIGSNVVAALKAHRMTLLARGLRASAWVFPNEAGGPMDKRGLMRRIWYPLLERARVRRVRFHDLRHTAASLMLLNGVHPRVVQERLGHASIAITMDLYSHVAPSLQREAADQVDRLFAS